jgi:hypothetical protein
MAREQDDTATGDGSLLHSRAGDRLRGPREHDIMTARTTDSRRATRATDLLVGVVIVLTLMMYAVLRYPASISQGGGASFFATTLALAVYGSGAVWARRQPSESLEIALEKGATLALVLGAVAIVNHSLEMFAALRPSLSAIRGVGMWALMFLAFGGAASATYHRVVAQSSGSTSVHHVWPPRPWRHNGLRASGARRDPTNGRTRVIATEGTSFRTRLT